VVEASVRLDRYLADRERRSKRRKTILLILLVLLLALLTYSALYYQANRRLPVPFVTGGTQAAQPPEFLYAIAGPEGKDALAKPIGVCVTNDDRVYVTDLKSDVVRVYRTDGSYLFSFGALTSDEATHLAQPGRVAQGPSGEIWVTDRRLRGIFVFDKDGAFKRRFVPKSDAATTWAPISVTFGPDGKVYVCDVGQTRGHRVLVFEQDGTEVLRFGKTVQANRMQESPGSFYFPNSIAIGREGEIFVSDGNNRRVQVFDAQGRFLRLIASSGTPRGMAIDSEQRLIVVDPLAHTIDAYDLEGNRLVSFGGPGIGPGQFQYPNDIALDKRGRMFITDRENHQVQVWGWPTTVVPPVTPPEKPVQWALCLSPLLLLLLPLAFRKRRVVVTEDFLEALAAMGRMDVLGHRRLRLIVPNSEYERLADAVLGGVQLGDLLVGEPHSESDVADLIEKTGVDRDTAILLSLVQRVGRLGTQDPELAHVARALDAQVYDAASFVEERDRKAKR
jgi:DNA-binding beta-propeller fold protein YncE